MKSPRDMKVIQIDITNACKHRCSNCTRFCGHHEKSFFMDFDTFKRAVDSLEGYVGTIGMMGGEPTLHPEFERFARYLHSKLTDACKKKEHNFIYPQDRFMESMHNQEFENTIAYSDERGRKDLVYGAGLWSAMGESYKRHYELIQDIFSIQAVNDHANAMYHQPILISRKELGIPDDEWLQMRNRCWVNQTWSASITPKGAFFCEIAAALDMLFDGPGGWPIEPGWWKREEKDFGEQLRWCEICGIALDTFTRDANEEIDDISPMLFEKLKEIKSPKIAKGKYHLININNGMLEEQDQQGKELTERLERYTDSYEKRFSATDTVLYPKGFVGVLICGADVCTDAIEQCVKDNEKQFQRYMVIILSDDIKDQLEGLESVSDKIHVERKETYGWALNYALSNCRDGEFLVLHTPNIRFAENYASRLSKCIINPGTMHWLDVKKSAGSPNDYITNYKELQDGYAAMFGPKALSLRSIGYDGVAQCESITDLVERWQSSKIVELSNKMNYIVPEVHLTKGTRYVLYGTGIRAHEVYRNLQNLGMKPVMVIDSDSGKWGQLFYEYEITGPDKLQSQRDCYDKVIVASVAFYKEIKQQLITMGLKENEISLGE